MGFWGLRSIEEDPDQRGRTFVWARDRRLAQHLFAFLVFSVLVHGAGFYLFKVVYPSPGRVGSRAQGVVVMDAADPAVRPALQRFLDRTVYLSPPSEQSEVRIGLDPTAVRFRPSFETREAALEPPPSPLEPMSGELPRPPRPDAGVPFKLAPALAGRAVAPWSILRDYLALAEGLPPARLALEIAADGSVRVGGVEAALDETAKAELASIVEATLRFVPAEAAASGWLEIGGG